MTTSLLCASHSPLLFCYAKPPAELDQLNQVFAERAEAIKSFDPELVLAFGSDHYNGFFLKTMPAFCVGLKAQTENDIGGFSGDLNVPADIALQCIEHLRNHDVDPAVSYEMLVDHAFSQTIQLALGGLDKFPVIPVFISCLSAPFVPFRRSRKLGEAIGEFISSFDKRVLLLASGGMSHHPARYYPGHGEGEEDVERWKLSGDTDSQSMSRTDWLTRLHDMHHEGAEMIARGLRTAKDMRLNAESDRRFLDILCNNNLEEFDDWNLDVLVEEAGIGSLELHTWIAAVAAHRAAGGDMPTEGIYTLAPEIGIAAGIVHAD
ncbi:MAG: 3-carboxyethylcatechol 2,3-dioxygenase [Gammaproteobacteria bacterium]|nr:3-carboxyethylcatechol 2,3-dioxygenase [Gammaproteobacteria bacterium]